MGEGKEGFLELSAPSVKINGELSQDKQKNSKMDYQQSTVLYPRDQNLDPRLSSTVLSAIETVIRKLNSFLSRFEVIGRVEEENMPLVLDYNIQSGEIAAIIEDSALDRNKEISELRHCALRILKKIRFGILGRLMSEIFIDYFSANKDNRLSYTRNTQAQIALRDVLEDKALSTKVSSRVGRVYFSASFVGSPRRPQRSHDNKNLSEMVHMFMIHSHGSEFNRDSPVCINHSPKPVSNRTYINSCGFLDKVFVSKDPGPICNCATNSLGKSKIFIFNKVDEIQQALGNAVLPLELYFSRSSELNNYLYSEIYKNFIVVNPNKVPKSVSNWEVLVRINRYIIYFDGHTFGSYQDADIYRGLLVSEMRQDFIEQGMDNEQSNVALLQELQSRLILMAATLSQFGLPGVPMIHNLELETGVVEYRSFVEA
ncbi:hypothetical protein BB560_003518 [Smittium megazygosporum]|uniref:Uncharacterized protein n=1 Tax=Smittium megazygosporum TaxID=133381 RepID=A0A2T9ZBQ9_9FUNG|nr:hypothetical protein BB560_003518 [Smittium megazygosporum]